MKIQVTSDTRSCKGMGLSNLPSVNILNGHIRLVVIHLTCIKKGCAVWVRSSTIPHSLLCIIVYSAPSFD
jgi:hypothetical protein